MRLHFSKATSIFVQTMPFVLLRLGVAALFGLATVLYFAITAGAIYLLGGSVSGLVLAAVLAASIGIFLAGVRFLGKYVLYLVSAGHIAVIAHIVDTGNVPSQQISFGNERVKANFVEASGLFVLDRLIKGVLNQFNQAVVSLSGLVNFVPALKNIVAILRKSVTLVGRHLDQAILAHIFISDTQSNWRAARDGLVLYGKTWRTVLGSSILIILAMYVLIALGALLLSPLALAIGQLSPIGQFVGWAVLAGLVVTLHFGLVDPWVKTVLITTFLIESENETPDSATMDTLVEKSSKFRELLEKEASEAEQPPNVSQPGGVPAADGGTLTSGFQQRKHHQHETRYHQTESNNRPRQDRQ